MHYYSKPPPVPVLHHMVFSPESEREPLEPLQHTLIESLPPKAIVSAPNSVPDSTAGIDELVESLKSGSIDLDAEAGHLKTLIEPELKITPQLLPDSALDLNLKSLRTISHVHDKPDGEPGRTDERGWELLEPELRKSLRTTSHVHGKPDGEPGQTDERGWELEPELRKCDEEWDHATFQEFKNYIFDLVETRLNKAVPFTRQDIKKIIEIYDDVQTTFTRLKLDVYQDYWPIRYALMLRLKRTSSTVKERKKMSHTIGLERWNLSAGPVTPCPLSSTTTVSGFGSVLAASNSGDDGAMGQGNIIIAGIRERSTSDELDFMQASSLISLAMFEHFSKPTDNAVSLQDLTRPLDELIGFEMPQGFQYNELLNIVATTVLDYVVELIGSKKPQGSQYNELLNIFAKPTYPPIMQDEMNGSHWMTCPGLTDDPPIILRKATDNRFKNEFAFPQHPGSSPADDSSNGIDGLQPDIIHPSRLYASRISFGFFVLCFEKLTQKLMNHQFTDATNGSSEAIHGILARLQLQGLSPHTRIQRLRRLSDIVLLHLQRPPPTCLTEESLIKFEPRDTLGPVCFEAIDLAFQHLQGSTREYLLQQWASFRPWLDLFLKKLVAPAEAGDDAINQEMLYDTMWSIVGHFISHCQPLSLSDSYPGLIGLTTGLWIHGSNQNILSDLHCTLVHSVVHPDLPLDNNASSRSCKHVLPVEMSEYIRALPDAYTILLDQIPKSLEQLVGVDYPIDMVSILFDLLLNDPDGVLEPLPRIISRRAVVLFCQLLERIIALPISKKPLSEFEGLLFRSLGIILHLFRRDGPGSIQQALQNQLLQTIASSFERLTASTIQYMQPPTQRLLFEIADHFEHPNVLHAGVNAVRRLVGHEPLFNYWTTFLVMLERRKGERKDFKNAPFPLWLTRAIISKAQKMRWLPRGEILLSRLPESTLEAACSGMSATIVNQSILYGSLANSQSIRHGDMFPDIRDNCNATTNKPHLPGEVAFILGPIINHGHYHSASMADRHYQPDKYACDGVIKTMLLAAMDLPVKAMIYGPVLDAQGSMCATYSWVEFGFNPFTVYEVDLIKCCEPHKLDWNDGLERWSRDSLSLIIDHHSERFQVCPGRVKFGFVLDICLAWQSQFLNLVGYVRALFQTYVTTNNAVSLQDLTRPLDELIGFEMPQGFQYNELLNIVATTVLDCNHVTLNLSNRFAITRGPVSLEKRRRWFLSESIIALTRLRISGPFSFHKDVVELIGSKKPQGSQYNELLNIFAKPTYPPIMQDEMNSSHWTTWPGPTDDPVIILRKATDNVSSLLTHAGCRGVDSF
ncbi:hypothetical protein C8J56DRAFT_890478 [Mycena floridula]|nr:hypothetical protein C8J56DRAFT_890478 [Mycena floridula]